MGGKMAYGLNTLRLALRYQAHNIRVQIDEVPLWKAKVLSVTCANGAYMGGGMHTTPDADISDGQFEVLFIKDMPVIQRLLNFPRIYSGTHLKSRFVEVQPGRTVQLFSAAKIPVEADGEFLGYLPARVRILPKTLNIQQP